MKRGNLITYDESGKIFSQTGEAEGNVLPHEYPIGIPYMEFEFGSMKDRRITHIDTSKEPHEPVFRELIEGDIIVQPIKKKRIRDKISRLFR